MFGKSSKSGFFFSPTRGCGVLNQSRAYLAEIGVHCHGNFAHLRKIKRLQVTHDTNWPQFCLHETRIFKRELTIFATVETFLLHIFSFAQVFCKQMFISWQNILRKYFKNNTIAHYFIACYKLLEEEQVRLIEMHSDVLLLYIIQLIGRYLPLSRIWSTNFLEFYRLNPFLATSNPHWDQNLH